MVSFGGRALPQPPHRRPRAGRCRPEVHRTERPLMPLGKQYSAVAACTPATDGKCRYFRIIFWRDQPLEEAP